MTCISKVLSSVEAGSSQLLCSIEWKVLDQCGRSFAIATRRVLSFRRSTVLFSGTRTALRPPPRRHDEASFHLCSPGGYRTWYRVRVGNKKRSHSISSRDPSLE